MKEGQGEHRGYEKTHMQPEDVAEKILDILKLS